MIKKSNHNHKSQKKIQLLITIAMQLQSHLYDTPKALLNPLQSKLHLYTEFIDNGCLVTKKRFLARLRLSFRMDIDSEFRLFYGLVVDTQFKSIMRNNLTITINY